MSRHKTKEQERHFIEVFKNVFPDFPDGKLLVSESPDFLLMTPQGQIGIEVTRIHQKPQTGKPSLKQQESERCAVVLEALRIYEAKRLPKLHVSIHFGSDASFNRKNRTKFASALANLIMSKLPREDNYVELDNDWDHPKAFPYEFDAIYMIRGFGMTKNIWTCPAGAVIREHFVNELQEIITSKESKLRNYCPDCVAHWLLVVAENSNPSTSFDPSELTLKNRYGSSFSRVFLLNSFIRKMFELKLCSS